MYVGNIPVEVDDAAVRAMLSECGRFFAWNRVPSAKKEAKSFGYAKMSDPEVRACPEKQTGQDTPWHPQPPHPSLPYSLRSMLYAS